MTNRILIKRHHEMKDHRRYDRRSGYDRTDMRPRIEMRGEYVREGRREFDRPVHEYGKDYGYDYGYDYRGNDYRDMTYSHDYRRDYRSDYRGGRDYHSEEELKKEYHKDLAEWIAKLKKMDRFGIPMNELVKKAREMGVTFKSYNEEEFYATYLMLVSDYECIGNDFVKYLLMAREFLEDEDCPLNPSEKLAAYLYEIVMPENV